MRQPQNLARRKNGEITHIRGAEIYPSAMEVDNDKTQHDKDNEADLPTWFVPHATNATPAVPQRYAGSSTSSKAAGVKVCGDGTQFDSARRCQ